MRRIFLSFSIIAFSLTSVLGQNVDEVLADHYKASGQDRMAKIKTITTKGKNAYAMAGIESAFTMYQSRPNMLRVQAEFQGSDVIQTFDGVTGWMYAPSMGITQPQEMGSEELESILEQTQFESLLWNYQEKGNTVELDGSTGDGSAYKVKMTKKDGEIMTICIDKESHLMSKVISAQVMGGAEADIEITMKDYKTIKGIAVPYYIVTKMDGEIMSTVNIESVEYNKKMDPALFKKPATE